MLHSLKTRHDTIHLSKDSQDGEKCATRFVWREGGGHGGALEHCAGTQEAKANGGWSQRKKVVIFNKKLYRLNRRGLSLSWKKMPVGS